MMDIEIAAIPEEGLRVTASLDPEHLALATADVRFPAPLEAAARFSRCEEDLLVEVEVDGTAEYVCGRCLQSFRQPYHGAFHLEVEIQGRRRVDVADEIRQEILLSYPWKVVCREHCRGLCPRCGQDLNQGACACPRSA